MAKSTRSKVKRAYRAKKREDSVYAAIEAARLERLSSKLRAIREADKEGDVKLADVIDEEDTPVPGSSWFLLFGLVDHSDVNLESLERINQVLNYPLLDAY
ncbi:hypothetical protein A7U60_g8419 [Sanghuangporus baumii]|uniref:DUF2423 domain-containing protein n=1 Tax=Sanghuangporus baumii TaxID=108892 RepID=A0A9Q5HRA6_SANBA|nr:hypothetical protein A7U60_g8419 [Sanghuangporus baumii]